MLSILSMPISVMLVILTGWSLQHLALWWLCTARLDDVSGFWMGSESSLLSPLSMLVTVASAPITGPKAT